ncbi:MAG: polynucleotide adenylyltransferase PcnB, partial [Myxococcota bacterium]
MELLIETLRVLREVRDWTDSRSLDRKRRVGTRDAVQRALATAEATVAQHHRPTSVKPLGPARQGRALPADRPKNRENPDIEPAEDQAIPLSQIDGQALSAIRRLRRYGYRAYLVGGCVRDLLLGFTPKDFDVATDARPEEVKSLFRNSRIIGRRFRLVHLYFRGGKVIEVSTFRANITADEDDADLLIRRDNVFGSEEEDARRRDFTINGLFYDLTTGKIIDHVGGMVDVRQRYLRMIGDPDIRLREDPVRILRAIRFTAKLQVRMDPELNDAIRRNRDEISKCAPARVMEETFRLLRIGHSERTVELMDELGVLPVLLPEIRAFLDGHLPGAEQPLPEEALPENAELLKRHLRALDRMIQERPVSDEVVLGALLYTPLNRTLEQDDDSGRDRNRAIANFLSSIGTRINLTRRLSEHLKQIFLAQRSLL